MQPSLLTSLSEALTVTVSQLSVAVAVPRAASIATAAGLQPRLAPSATEPVAVMTGSVVSTFHVTVREIPVAALPQPSVALQLLVCERRQPLLVTVLSEAVGVTGSQLSVAVALPRAASISA